MLSGVCDEEERTEADVGLLLAIFLSSLSLSSTNDLDLSCPFQVTISVQFSLLSI
jgi:hypothetical protein